MNITRPLRLISLLSLMATLAFGCASDEQPYDPDADANLAVAGGKADGIFDIIPVIAFDSDETGTIADDDVEFYRIDLQRTDNVTVTMEATSGNLNPHSSFYFGTSTYVSSDSYDLAGDTITKIYTAESSGTFLIAARVYRQSGQGDYRVRISCNDGPCAGNFPDPVSFLEVDDVEECISAANECALAALPAYAGRVGAARANLVFQNCLNENSTWGGDSCSTICDWENPDDSDDTTERVCDLIVDGLPWFADQSPACVAEFDSCLDVCSDAAGFSGGSSSTFIYGAVGNCRDSGLNGDCNTYVRDLEVCGGDIAPESAGSCELLCLSTTGAFTDDTSDLCGVDNYCDEECDTDIDLAGAECGGVSAANQQCLQSWLDDHYAYFCENALEARL